MPTWNLFENLNLSALWMILKGSALGFRGRDLSLAVGALELCVILTIVENSIVRKSIELGFARVRNASGDGVRGLES